MNQDTAPKWPKAIVNSILSILFFINGVDVALAQAIPAETAKKIDSLFKQWDNKHSPGCAIGIVRNDSLIYAKGYGMANLENSIPITTQTEFEMGSVSKQFTAYAILLLAKQGKVSLDDDIHKYLPWAPHFEKKITISNLLYHTSGIRDYDQLLSIAGTTQEDVITREHVIKVLSKQQTLNFDPGKQYMYSNSGYFLLGEIVRSVTGKTLRQFTDSVIFKPLGMNNTHFYDDYTEVVANRAYPYMQADKISIVNSSAVGAKGLFTNIDDMSKWAMFFLNNKSENHPIIEQMMQSGKLNNGKETRVGAGLQIQGYRGLKTYHHGGIDGGYHNSVMFLPEMKMAFIVFSNNGSIYTGNQYDQMADLFIKHDVTVRQTMPNGTRGAMKKQDPFNTLTDKQLMPYAGKYYCPELGCTYGIELKDHQLVLTNAKYPDSPLTFYSQTRMINTLDWMKNLDFTKDKKGKITGFDVNYNLVQDVRFEKIE
jgi:CubicO group peptidase (beta-lactamase class C family)